MLPFTSFDAVNGPKQLLGNLHWQEADFILRAVEAYRPCATFTSAWLSSPANCVTAQWTFIGYRRAIVIDCRYVGSEVYVPELMPNAKVQDVIARIAGRHTFTALADAIEEGAIRTSVNGNTVHSTDTLPQDADVFALQEDSGNPAASSGPASAATTEPFEVFLPQRSPTPPLPQEQGRVTTFPRRWKRPGAVSSAEQAYEANQARSSLEDPNSRRCTIFDPLRQVEIVYTIACKSPFRFLDWAITRAQHLGTRPDGRVINNEFDSFPGPQICIHPPLRSDNVTLPVEVSPGIV